MRWDYGTSLTDPSGFKVFNKKSVSESSPSSNAMRPKKELWKRSYDSSSPLRRGGARTEGGRDAKPKKFGKKLSLVGKRKGASKSKSSSAIVTLADLAQSIPRASISISESGMESPIIGNGKMGHGNQMIRNGSMELELCDTTPSSSSRKSYNSAEDESSLSERELYRVF